MVTDHSIASKPLEPALYRCWLFATAILCLGLMGLVGVFWGTAGSMVRTWSGSDTYSYGFLVLPICVFLLWRQKQSLTGVPPKPNFWGITLILAMAILWLLGDVTATLMVQQFAFIGLFQGFFLTVLGSRAFRLLLFPLLYLYLAVPFGDFLIAPLQELTSQFAVKLLLLSGVPVFSDGFLIHIPTATFLVAEACAGARFLFSTLALGILVSNFYYRSWPRRTLFIALSIAIPIFANILRAYSIVMIAHYDSLKVANQFDHITFGFVFLGAVTLALLVMGATFRENRPQATRSSSANPLSENISVMPSFLGFILAGGAAFAAAVLPFAWNSSAGTRSFDREVVLGTLVVQDPWVSLEDSIHDWQPRYYNVDAESLGVYENGQKRVGVYAGYYLRERQGAEVINDQNSLTGEGPWRQVNHSPAWIIIDGSKTRVNQLRATWGARGKVIWYWYWVDGRFVANPYIAKLLQAKVRLWGGDEEVAVVALASDHKGDLSEAVNVLKDFLNHAAPISDWLKGASP